MTAESANRFWSHVRFGDGCWEWTGALNHAGYGRFGLNGRTLFAHRVAYELSVGPIDNHSFIVIDHLCLNPQCVRPDHLEMVTQRENARRALCESRTHYRCGHLRSSAGGRRCKQCNSRLTLARYHAKKGIAK